MNESTKFSPAEIVLGEKLKLPLDLLIPTNPKNEIDCGKHHIFVRDLKKKLAAIFLEVDEILKENNGKMKQYFDKKLYESKFQVGDYVLTKTKTGSKLDPLFDGPYKVVTSRHPNYSIQRIDESDKPKLIHHNLLYPCNQHNTDPFDDSPPPPSIQNQPDLEGPPQTLPRRSKRVRIKRKLFGNPVTDFEEGE